MKEYLKKLIIFIVICGFTSCTSGNDKHMETVKKNYKSVEKLWNDFLEKTPDNKVKEIPLSFYFCDNKKDADECATLVVEGIKQATASSLWWYEKHQEPLPRIGDQYVITDWNGNAKAIIETTRVEQVPYNKITTDFARTEGEGDKSLAYWKRVHEAYYKREMEPYGDKFDEHMIIVCEYFKTIYLR